MKKSSVGSILFTGLLLAALIYAGLNAQGIYDWFVLQTYDPPAEIVEYADETELSEYGRRVLYVANPQLSAPEEFNDSCVFKEFDRVLGCYDGVRIYVLDVDEPKLEDVEPVTAVHEMLHAGYDRLSRSERQRVDELLLRQQKQLNDQDLEELLEEYRKEDPELVVGELYARFGTEFADLIPELEEHYAQYFEDRTAVVSLHAGYQKVFDDVDAKLTRITKQLDSLNAKLKNLEKKIEEEKKNLDRINKQLDAYLASNNISAYNNLIPSQNAAVNSYNSSVRSFNATVESYNAKVEEYEETALYQTDLYNSIDSNFQEAHAQ